MPVTALLMAGWLLGAGAQGAPAAGMTAEALRPILARYNARAAAFRSVSGSGLAVLGADGEKTRTFRFSLVAERPDRARLQGRWGNLTQIFDLAASEGGWTLFLPRERKVVRSADDRTRAGLLVPPAELLAALLPETVDEAALAAGGAWSVEGSLLRLVVPPGAGARPDARHRVLWVETGTGIPRRMELRERSQLEAPVLTVTWEDPAPEGPARVIRLEGDGGAAWARFTFESRKANVETDPRRFSVLVPPGTREIPPGELGSDFLPEAGPDAGR